MRIKEINIKSKMLTPAQIRELPIMEQIEIYEIKGE